MKTMQAHDQIQWPMNSPDISDNGMSGSTPREKTAIGGPIQTFFSDFGTPEKNPEKNPESKKIPNRPEFFAALRAAFSILL